MKHVILRFAYAVGMHHWGPRSLEIDEPYVLKAEPQNPYDKNAVSIATNNDTQRKLGYLSRDTAKYISAIILAELPHGKVYGKAKGPLEFRNRRHGPQQIMAIAFKCNEENIQKVMDTLRHCPFSVTVKNPGKQ